MSLRKTRYSLYSSSCSSYQ